jgi:hypothetical protein
VRNLRLDAEFDGAFCMGNAFGYFGFRDLGAFVHGLSRALRPGARFVIETGTVAEVLLPGLREREWWEADGILLAEEHRYLIADSCLETRATFVHEGRTETRVWWHWIYTVAEVRRLLGDAGLVVLDLYAAVDRKPFECGAQNLLLVGRKE